MTSKNSRRDFLKTTTTATTAVAAASLLPVTLSAKDGTPARGVAIILNPEDGKAKPAQWAAMEFRNALRNRELAADIFPDVQQAPAGFECVVAATGSSSPGRKALAASGVSLPSVPEAVALARAILDNRRILLAAGSDVRGLVYALLELADRVNFPPSPSMRWGTFNELSKNLQIAFAVSPALSSAKWKTSRGLTIAKCGLGI